MNRVSSPAQIARRFWAKVDKLSGEGACWEWTGAIGSSALGVSPSTVADIGRRKTWRHLA